MNVQLLPKIKYLKNIYFFFFTWESSLGANNLTGADI